MPRAIKPSEIIPIKIFFELEGDIEITTLDELSLDLSYLNTNKNTLLYKSIGINNQIKA